MFHVIVLVGLGVCVWSTIAANREVIDCGISLFLIYVFVCNYIQLQFYTFYQSSISTIFIFYKPRKYKVAEALLCKITEISITTAGLTFQRTEGQQFVVSQRQPPLSLTQSKSQFFVSNIRPWTTQAYMCQKKTKN